MWFAYLIAFKSLSQSWEVSITAHVWQIRKLDPRVVMSIAKVTQQVNDETEPQAGQPDFGAFDCKQNAPSPLNMTPSF